MDEIVEKIYKEAHYCRYQKKCLECDRYIDNKCTWVFPPDVETDDDDVISKSMIEWVLNVYKNCN